jgi:hypothetical protein
MVICSFACSKTARCVLRPLLVARPEILIHVAGLAAGGLSVVETSHHDIRHEAGVGIHSARFMDSRCATLQRTAKNLIDDRPDINDEEIADLLNVSVEDAAWLRHAVSEGRDSGLGA